MKKNLYFTSVCQRRNPIREALLNFFLGIASYPKLLLEVFIRRDMGCRYFNLFPVTVIGLFLIIFPLFMASMMHGADWSDIMALNWGWYLFTAGFLIFSYFRYQESKYYPDEKHMRFSRSTGKLLPFVQHIGLGPARNRTRIQETFVEPLLVIGVAILFYIVNQYTIAALLFCCALIYCLSYIGIYGQGDDFVLDKIDELICAEDMADAFKHGITTAPSGFRFFGYRPESTKLLEDLYERMLVNSDYVTETY